MGVDPSGSNPNMDMQAHQQTYNLFIRLTQIGIAVVVLILVGMAVFLL